MKIKMPIVLPTLLALLAPPLSYAETGNLFPGTLASEKLLLSAMDDVAITMINRGCELPEQFYPFIIKFPDEQAPVTIWRERWVLTGCEQEYPIDIEFKIFNDESSWVIISA